jgi:hypothetical protein
VCGRRESGHDTFNTLNPEDDGTAPKLRDAVLGGINNFTVHGVTTTKGAKESRIGGRLQERGHVLHHKEARACLDDQPSKLMKERVSLVVLLARTNWAEPLARWTSEQAVQLPSCRIEERLSG